MSDNGFGTRNWLLIVLGAAAAAFLVVWLFFPQIMGKMAAGIVAFFAFLIGLIFKRKKT